MSTNMHSGVDYVSQFSRYFRIYLFSLAKDKANILTALAGGDIGHYNN